MRRWFIVGLVLFAVYSIAGFLILPRVVKIQLQKRLSAELGRPVAVAAVRLNPYTLSTTLENFAVFEPDGQTKLLAWRRLYVNFDALSSIWGEWVLSDIIFEGLSGRVVVNADGTLNFSDILQRFQNRPAAPAASEPGRPVRIRLLRVVAARLEFSDLSRPKRFDTTLGPVSFALAQFRTVSHQGAPYSFEAVTESGERLTWGGTLEAQPFRSSGELSIENVQLPKYAPYYADRFHGDVASGQVSVRARYDVDLSADHPVLKLTDGAVQLRDLKVREPGNEEPVVELPLAELKGLQADGRALSATIASVTLGDGHIRLRREKDGALNLLALLPSAPAVPSSPAQPPSPSPTVVSPAATTPAVTTARTPDVTVGDFAIRNFTIDVTDLAAARPAQLSLGEVQLSLKNITLADKAQIPLQLSFNWAPRGSVRLDGNISLRPMRAALNANIEGLQLPPLSPYLEQFANAQLTDGAITAALNVVVGLPESQPLDATMAGTVTVDKVALVDGVHHEELAGFDSLALHGLFVATVPEPSLVLEEAVLHGPYARVSVNQDKTLNLALVAIPAKPAGPAAPAAPTPKTPAPASPKSKVQIGRVTITDANYRFVDRSIEPNVRLEVRDFGGTISGLSSDNPGKATVDLKAAVDGTGPVAISGRLDPLSATKLIDLKLDVKNVDLVPLSPYCGRYAGFELTHGKLVIDTKLLLSGDTIDAANVITLHQFTLGSPVESPDATKLPVRLGIALLKDMDGKIVIDVPVKGQTSDPNFKIGRVVARVIVNLLTKAATSPFSLLGAAFGGGGEELSFQQFKPGANQLEPEENKKLETLTKALNNRPALNLDIEGSFDTTADVPALKRARLEDSIRHTLWETKRASDPNLHSPEQLAVTPEEREAEIRRLYVEKFPGGASATPAPAPTATGATPATASPTPNAAPAAEPQRGLLARLFAAITFQHARQRAAEKPTAPAPVPSAENPASAAPAQPAVVSVEDMATRLADTVTVNDNDLRGLAEARAHRIRDYFIETGKIAPDRLFLSKSDNTKAGKGAKVFLHLQ